MPSPQSLDLIPRRGFLRLVWAGILTLSGLIGIGGFLRFLAYQPVSTRPKKLLLSKKDEIPIGSVIVFPEAQAAIQHDEQGLTGVSATCPHLGCLVKATQEGFSCPCHGSQFDIDGSLLHGPARSSLVPLEIEDTAEGVWVTRGEQ